MILLVAMTNEGIAQDPYFTQNLFHKLYLSPAYTGYGSKLSTSTSYRNQWRNDDLPSYRTLYTGVDAKAFCFNNSSYVAFGGFLVFDQEFGGMISNTNANLSMAASLQLSKSRHFESRMMIGLSGGLYSRSYDLSDDLLFESIVTSGSNFDPIVMDGIIYGDDRMVEDVGVGLGLQFTFNDQYSLLIGAAGTHLTSPLLFGNDRLARKFNGNILASARTGNGLNYKAFSDFSLQGKAMRTHAGAIFGLSPDLSNNNKGDDFGIQAGLTLSVVGDHHQSMALESISPVLILNYLLFDFVVTKDINISTSSVAHQKGGLEFTFRFKINDHKIKSKERLPRLCTEDCPLP